MSKEEEISKALDAKPDNIHESPSPPAAEQKGLNGHGDESTAEASLPQEEEKSVPSSPSSEQDQPGPADQINKDQPELNDAEEKPQEQTPKPAQDQSSSPQENLENEHLETSAKEVAPDPPEAIAQKPPAEQEPEDDGEGEVPQTTAAETALGEELAQPAEGSQTEEKTESVAESTEPPAEQEPEDEGEGEVPQTTAAETAPGEELAQPAEGSQIEEKTEAVAESTEPPAEQEPEDEGEGEVPETTAAETVPGEELAKPDEADTQPEEKTEAVAESTEPPADQEPEDEGEGEVPQTTAADTAPGEELVQPAEGIQTEEKTEEEKTEAVAESTEPPAEQEPSQVVVWESTDFSALDKSGLVALIEEMAKADDPIGAERVSKKVRPFFINIQKDQRQQALDQFTAAGNDADGFAYRFDELDNRFDAAFKLLRDRKFQSIRELEHDKERNLQEKTQLLEELRALVEAEETNSSINALKKIQDRWRSLGPIPGQHAKTMWANYHALLDLYYDHRSIYFELKELDRKKNLEAKLELCERAEKLEEQKNLKEAISELNELHDEFKHIGPVPKSEQEALWQRFKGASDKIYARRKEFVKHLKEDLKENLIKKSELAEEVQQYADFNSDRITEWNKKTQALLGLQKRWDAIGGLPREKAKEVNRKFWGAFKGFFQHKGQFFKKLEGERGSNLEKKQVLVEAAQALKESTEWDQTANKLKNLQKQWREIGPVPEKNRNEIYARFKEACDHFFNNRRAQSQEVEKEYVANLKKKQDICMQIESMTSSKDYDLDKFTTLKDQFNAIGYVPSSEVRNIREQFRTTVKAYLAGAPEELQAEAQQIKYDIDFEKLKSGPNAGRKKGQKEQALRREIGTLENDISTWKNNLEFFTASKTADKLREEFTGKIDAASDQLRELKRQLRALRQL